ncbi:MAG TPA: xanthine dehydrogenase family protein molybdopterin-binding subunit [Acidimicrobiales bacterium]
MAGRFSGQSIERIEDDRLLRGRGAFVGGFRRDGMAHVAFVRSPHAHARITSIDCTRALALPGVRAVYTGDDIAAVMVAPMAIAGPPDLKTAPFWPVARDKVRFVGDPVAVVVADSEVIAHDARDLVDVDYEPLPAVVDIEQACDPASTPLWDELGGNVAIREQHEWGDVADAFARARHVVRRRFVQHRVTHAPMEPRAAIASYEPVTGRLRYEASHKRPHPLKLAVSGLLGIPFPDIHICAGDIGGGFGSKGQITREDVALCAVAKLYGRPVKWVETRSENLAVAGHARDESLDVEAAVDDDGRVFGLRVAMTLDAGAYPMLPFPASFFATLVRMLLPNAYRIPAYRFDSTVVYTNKASYISYRGPWAVETWVREAMMDAIARELDLTPEEVRRRNLFAADDLPTRTTTGATVDGITARETLERAVELLDVEKFRAEQREARARGRLLGLGLATFIEIAPGPPDFAPLVGFDLPSETASARIDPTGHVTISTWQVPQGQSHETTLAQVVADELGVDLSDVRIVWGDSATTPFNTISTGGSRSATMATGAAVGATRLVKNMVVRIAAHMLEANEADIEIVDRSVRVRGTPSRAIPLADVARTAWFAPSSLPDGLRQGLEASYDHRVPHGGWTSATHAAIVEIDPETGEVRVLRYLVVEDCGELINPAVVEGQIMGGVAQGIAQVLYERIHYDLDGQLLTSSLADYLVPSAADLPSIEIEHLELGPYADVPRGVGEGGMIGAPAAICNAVSDALAPFGVEVERQHLSPERVLSMINRR